jgi:hypothetical protein
LSRFGGTATNAPGITPRVSRCHGEATRPRTARSALLPAASWLTLKVAGCDLGSVRFPLPAAVIVVGTMSALGAPAATSARAPTQMYLGRASVAAIQPEGRRAWHVDCAAVDGEEVFTGARHRAVWVRHWDGYLDGYALLRGTGRWAIFRYATATRRLTVVGFAMRWSSTRWDVLRGRRTIGHTMGPDGPEAAAALLTVC